jgi:hypothetical protein
MSATVIFVYPAPGREQNLPEIHGKFLQLTWHGQEYLIFAPFGLHRYHNQILGHFLEDHAVPHRWVTKEKLEVDALEPVVVGGGRFRVNTEQETLYLWDDSQVYGRFDERSLLEKIAAAGHDWSGFEVKIS